MSEKRLHGTNYVDFDLPRDGRDVVHQLQRVDAFVWTDAGGDHQLREGGLGGQTDSFISSSELLLSKGPLRNRGWVSSDGDSDDQWVRHNNLQAIFERTQIKCRANCGQKS